MPDREAEVGRLTHVAFRRMVAVPITGVVPGVAARPTAVLSLGVLACAHAELASALVAVTLLRG
jgi:hypothetical protein